ncbi:MAG: head maturation protease, ClpP-related [Ruminiclostridium sp.]
MKNKKFWVWKNMDGTESERALELYGTIAEESWFDDDVTPQMFRDELFAGSGPVTVWLNSPGGDCVAASQIYSMLMDYKGDVTIKIDGIAASAASVIAMAGTKVLMAPTALMMIHNPITMAYGNHDDMQKAIEMLDEVKESIINAYEIKTNLSRAKLSHLMDTETWMNANKAIELGFADDILEDEKKNISDIPAYAFSGRAAEISLMNKLTLHCKSEKKEPVGTPISNLEKRLNLLKP